VDCTSLLEKIADWLVISEVEDGDESGLETDRDYVYDRRR